MNDKNVFIGAVYLLTSKWRIVKIESEGVRMIRDDNSEGDLLPSLRQLKEIFRFLPEESLRSNLDNTT